jgi:hypothetical protein
VPIEEVMTTFSDDASLARKIAAYLSGQVGHAVEAGPIKRFPVGFSWLTYAVPVRGLESAHDEQELILRLGPDYGLFAPYSARIVYAFSRRQRGAAPPRILEQ